MRWSSKEMDYLRSNWGQLSISGLVAGGLCRSIPAMYAKAKEMGLSVSPKISSLAPLLEDNHLSFYWMGFLMADGHFDSKNKRLGVTLGYKDMEFLEKLAVLLGCKINTYARSPNPIIQLSVTDVTNFDLLVKKWDLKSNKTKFPPSDLPEMTQEYFFSWVTGFIDGDGSIETHGSAGTIVSGTEWGHILAAISNRLDCPNLKIRKASGFSNETSLRLRLLAKPLKILKIHALSRTLPILERKWNRVQLIDRRFTPQTQ
jgi:hypothetical protein